MKARKCIIKAGSLDNYLLTTKPKYLDSKYGLYLKDLIRKKKFDPEFKPGFIIGTAEPNHKGKKTQVWQYKQLPAMWIPAKVKASEDLSQFYEKPPSEMSRYELQELEKAMRIEREDSSATTMIEEDEPVFDKDGNQLTKLEAYKLTDEFLST